jgi:hypothetical protein
MSILRMTAEQVAERAAKLAKFDAPAAPTKPRAQKKTRQGIQPAPPLPTEHEQQAAFFSWWNVWAPTQKLWPGLCFAIPNSTPTARDRRMKSAEGLCVGVPDVFLAVQRGGFGGLFLELKRSRKSPVSEGQKEYLRELRRGFYQAHLIVDGWEEAARIVRRYLENGT